jgi:hypothetical protein
MDKSYKKKIKKYFRKKTKYAKKAYNVLTKGVSDNYN